MKYSIFIFVSFFFFGCSAQSNLEYKALEFHPQTTHSADFSMGVEKPTMPAYLISKKMTYLAMKDTIEDLSGKRWIEPFDKILQSSLARYLQEKYPNANIASYPWGFYQEPTTKLQLNIESISIIDNVLIFKAKYCQTKSKKSFLFEKHLVLQSNLQYDQALFLILKMLYEDISNSIKY
ncbi:MAG: membrane integrity-associated transporter subunit PqiC [Campylobacterales bacterium]|nr:membrane integrity-associated transporter subunit PqiC [Campylobacterales bacterium]